MAQFTRTHGDFQPVLWLDQPEYTTGAVNATASGLTVQPQGPKLDFFTIELADVAANTTIASQVILAVEQLSTIHIYEFTTGSDDTLALALYPTGAFDTTSLKATVDAATGGTSTVTATATFTN